MKSLLLLIVMSLSMPVLATNHLSGNTKLDLKKLYYQINAADDPHTDADVKNNVQRLVNKSCFESATKTLQRKSHLSFDKKAKIKNLMRSTCSCAAKSPDMINGVIESAQLFKAHGKHSKEARKAMKDGMKKAKMECFGRMRAQMYNHR